MNHLMLELAPLTDVGLGAIRDEATDALRHFLSARRLVDVEGPLGREAASVDLGRVDGLGGVDELGDGVAAGLRRVQPLVELRVPFAVRRSELEAADRGARDVDLGPVREAARRLAAAEDAAIYDGLPAAGVRGVREASPHEPLALGPALELPEIVAHALGTLRRAGVDAPYTLALGAARHEEALATTGDGGQTVFRQIERVLDGGRIVWAPQLRGGVLLSSGRGQFVMTLGEDCSIGYLDHDDDVVRLVLIESFTFRVLDETAAVVLRDGGAKAM